MSQDAQGVGEPTWGRLGVHSALAEFVAFRCKGLASSANSVFADAHQNTPFRTQQTESCSSHSTQSSAVNASSPNAGYHSERKSKCTKTTTHQTPVYIEPDTDADRQGEAVLISDSIRDEYHVSLPHSETPPDTEIDKDLDCHNESAARRRV